ncbi:MAG: phage tail sheath subtilisin-like domain-containing protein [Caldilineaceae bacterium]|nr:phage tail sheath subtilisin-like domain-containing protein [Caldilineaceae bacterium]
MAETFNVAEFVIPGTYVRVRAEGLISAGGISTGNVGIVGTARPTDVLHAASGRPIPVPADSAGDFVSVNAEGIPVVTNGVLQTTDSTTGTILQTDEDTPQNVVIRAEDEGRLIVVDSDGLPVLDGARLVTRNLYGTTHLFSDYATAQATLGPYDANSTGRFNLTRAMEVLFRNGARTVYARALNLQANDTPPGNASYTAAFNELLKENVNILTAPELTTTNAINVLQSLLETAENNGQDLLAVVGSDASAPGDITDQVVANDRLILVAPGIQAYDSTAGVDVTLSGTYSAAVVAGLLGTLTPQSSPTNKAIVGVTKLSQRFSYSETKDLITGGVFVMEERLGVRAVRGITTEMASNGPFKQITTRRIVDFAKAGIRQVSNPFIGRLNNQRVRKALQGAIDGFLTTMVQDEALTEYALEVTATRDDEIAGRAIVNAILKPTFSIDFIAVTLTLQ